MLVHVRLAEPYWRTVGQRDLELELEDQAHISDLLALLTKRYPALQQELVQAPPHLFIDDQEVGEQSLLKEGDRLYVLWPIAGGKQG